MRQGFVEQDPRPRFPGARLTLISRPCRLLFFDRRHLLAQGELLDLTPRSAPGATDDGRRLGGAYRYTSGNDKSVPRNLLASAHPARNAALAQGWPTAADTLRGPHYPISLKACCTSSSRCSCLRPAAARTASMTTQGRQPQPRACGSARTYRSSSKALSLPWL